MNNASSPLDDLFAQARRHAPATARAEYGFETRLLARLQESSREASIWSAVSWRMASVLALFVAVLACWQFEADGAAQDSEQTAYVQNPEALDLLSTF